MMSQGLSESDLCRYNGLLEKIESLKNLDPANYMKNIRMYFFNSIEFYN